MLHSMAGPAGVVKRKSAEKKGKAGLDQDNAQPGERPPAAGGRNRPGDGPAGRERR